MRALKPASIRGSCAPRGDGRVDDATVSRAFSRDQGATRPGERRLVAARGPENDAPRESP